MSNELKRRIKQRDSCKRKVYGPQTLREVEMAVSDVVWMINKTGGLPYVGNVPGNTRLNIPPLTLNDGPQGFRDNASPGTTTAWPSGLTMAASFDKDIMFEWGSGMGKEFKAKGSNVQLGPGL